MKNSFQSDAYFCQQHDSRKFARNATKLAPPPVGIIQRKFVSSDLGSASVEIVVLLFATISLAIASSIVVADGAKSLGAATATEMASATDIQQFAKNDDSSGAGSGSETSDDDSSSDDKKAKKDKKSKGKKSKGKTK